MLVIELSHIDVTAGEAATGAIASPAVRIRRVTTAPFLMIRLLSPAAARRGCSTRRLY